MASTASVTLNATVAAAPSPAASPGMKIEDGDLYGIAFGGE